MKIRVYLANKGIFTTGIIVIVYRNAKKAIIVIIILLDNVKNAKHNVKNVIPTKIVHYVHKDTIYKDLLA